MVQTVEHPTFETVWAALQETDRIVKEVAAKQKETVEQWKEQMKELRESRMESDRQFYKRFAETEKIIKRNGKQMGYLHRSFGELAEHLVAPGINKRFNELGYHFGEVAPGGKRIHDEKGKTLTEIDLMLENGETVMVVEVKTKPKMQDIDHHIRRLEIYRDHRRGINDQRTICGAIAGAVFGSEEKKATAEAGLYAIEQSGDTMKIDVPDGFEPRKW